MKVSEIISRIKTNSKAGRSNSYNVHVSADAVDQVLFGNPNVECKGIVTCIWPSYELIQKAIEKGANLIITHEALFWNHRDKTEWLEYESNQTFLEKRRLLQDGGIVVWRDHEYIHSGIPQTDGSFKDGIYLGVQQALGWTKYNSSPQDLRPASFEIPETTVSDVASYILGKLNLSGARLIGNSQSKISKIYFPLHILSGERDSELITKIANEGYQLIIPLEVIDYTTTEFVKDSSLMGMNKAILSFGHFNLEQIGMRYLADLLPDLLPGSVPISFVSVGDMYQYLLPDQH